MVLTLTLLASVVGPWPLLGVNTTPAYSTLPTTRCLHNLHITSLASVVKLCSQRDVCTTHAQLTSLAVVVELGSPRGVNTTHAYSHFQAWCLHSPHIPTSLASVVRPCFHRGVSTTSNVFSTLCLLSTLVIVVELDFLRCYVWPTFTPAS